MHLWAAQRQAGAQLTLEQLWIAPLAVPTAKSLCAPGHALIHHLFLEVSKAEEQYKQALTINPHHLQTLSSYARLLQANGWKRRNKIK